MTRTDDKTPNGALFEDLQKVSEEYFHIEMVYNCKMKYENMLNYGFTALNYNEWKEQIVYSADEYVSYLASTQIGHITLKEPYRTKYFNAVREAVLQHGNKMILNNLIALYLVKKALSR